MKKHVLSLIFVLALVGLSWPLAQQKPAPSPTAQATARGMKGTASASGMRHRGLAKVDWIFAFACAAYNLVRLRNLAVQPA